MSTQYRDIDLDSRNFVVGFAEKNHEQQAIMAIITAPKVHIPDQLKVTRLPVPDKRTSFPSSHRQDDAEQTAEALAAERDQPLRGGTICTGAFLST